MKFLSVFMSFVLVFNSAFYQAIAQTLQFEREPVTKILHTALNSKAQDKGYFLEPDRSYISWVPFEREMVEARGVPGFSYLSEYARMRWDERAMWHVGNGLKVIVIGFGLEMVAITFSIVTKRPFSSRILSSIIAGRGGVGDRIFLAGVGIHGVGMGNVLYGVVLNAIAPFSDRVFLGEFDYGMIMADQSLEPGYCSFLVSESGYFELTGCPSHPEILTSNQESQLLEITQPYKGAPFVVASGTLL